MSTETEEIKTEEKDSTKVEEKTDVDADVKVEDEKKEEAIDDKKEPTVEVVKSEPTEDVKADESTPSEPTEGIKEESEEKIPEVTQDTSTAEKTEDVADASTPKKRGRPPKKVTSPAPVKKEATPKAKKEEIKDEGAETKDTEDTEKASKKRKSESAMVLGAVGREGSKRERKSLDAFQPATFEVDRSVTIVEGRGTQLGDLPPCRKSIESISSDSVVTAVHRFLFSHRGKPSTKEMKQNILKFSGFLTKKVDPDEEKQDKLDNVEEAKMGQKAYKTKIAELRSLCDVLAIDRAEAKDKDGYVDALLDFLGAPNDSHLKGGTKKQQTKKRGRPSNAASDDGDEEMEDADEEKEAVTKSPKKEKGSAKKESKKESNGGGTPKKTVSTPTTSSIAGSGKLPADGELRDWVGAYVNCYNMSKSTIKHALQIASEKFDVDVTPLKAKLKQFLTEAL